MFGEWNVDVGQIFFYLEQMGDVPATCKNRRGEMVHKMYAKSHRSECLGVLWVSKKGGTRTSEPRGQNSLANGRGKMRGGDGKNAGN